MIKEYFWVAVIGLFLNAALIVADAAGFLPLSLLNFVLLFLVIFLLALYRPIWVFWIFIISLPLESVIISSYQIPISFRPFQVIGLMLFLATVTLIIFGVKNKNLPKIKNGLFWVSRSKFNFSDLLVLILGGFSFLSLLNTPDLMVTFKLNLVLLSFIMIYFLTRFYFQEKQRRIEALWFFMATSLPVLFFGIYQSAAFKLGWVDFQVFAERANGTFTEPDWFGIYLVFLGALAYWVKLWLYSTKNNTMIGQKEIRQFGQWVMNSYLFLVFWVLLLTVARSAWVGFLGVTITYFVLLIWQKYIYDLKKFSVKTFFKDSLGLGLVYLISILVVVGFGLSNFNLSQRASSSISGLQEITISCQKNSTVPDRIESTDVLYQYSCRHINLEEIDKEIKLGLEVKKVFRPDPNIEIRKNIYLITWSEIKKYPIIGQGLGSSSEILGEDSYGHGLNASNIFLEAWFSWGTLGLFIFVFLFISPVVLGLKNLISKRELGKSLFVVLTTVALILPNLFNAGIFLVIFWVWLAAVNSK